MNLPGKQKAKGPSSFLMLSLFPGDTSTTCRAVTNSSLIIDIAFTDMLPRAGAEAWHTAQKKKVVR